MKTPDWDLWLHVPEVKLWQAVCLSLNIEPDEYTPDDLDCDNFFDDNKAASRRLRLLVANLGSFSRFIIDYVDRHESIVRLADFTEWAVSKMKWDNIPPELAALAKDATQTTAKVEAAPADDHDETLAALFNPVTVAALEKMFPAGGKWKSWAEKAKANGLIIAREGTAMFNPYKAGVWFGTKGVEGWDTARLNRTLKNNLPARSRDEEHLLTGGID